MLALQFDHVHLAVDERAPSLAPCLFAVLLCQEAILSGQHTLLRGQAALADTTFTLPRGARDALAPGERLHAILLRVGDASLRHRDIARDRGLVSRERGDVAVLGDGVTLLARLQPPSGAVIALTRRPLALVCGALADALADVVLLDVPAGGEILIAGGLIAVGSQLVAISARLIAVSSRLIDIRQRLVTVGPRLVNIRERQIAISKRLLVLNR